MVCKTEAYNNQFSNTDDTSPFIAEKSSQPSSFWSETVLRPWHATKPYLYSLKKYLFCLCTEPRTHNDSLEELINQELDLDSVSQDFSKIQEQPSSTTEPIDLEELVDEERPIELTIDQYGSKIDQQILEIKAQTPCNPESIDLSIYDQNYQEKNFLRRISKKEWQALAEQMRQHGRPISPHELKAFQKGDWNHPIFQDTHWVLFAFHAYLSKDLDEDTMCKLFLYNACCTQVELDREKGRPYLEALQLYDDSGVLSERAERELHSATFPYLNKEQFKYLCNMLKELPPEQTQFFNIYRSMDDMLIAIAGADRTARLALKWPLWVMGTSTLSPNFVNDNWWTYQLVGSPHFMYLIHRAVSEGNAIHPAPHLGFSSEEEMDGDSRVVSIPSPFVNLPQNLHDKNCCDLSTFFHDVVYHHAIDSANEHRRVWIAFASYLEKHKDDLQIPSWMLYNAWDREFKNYVIKKEDYSPANFWISFCLYCDRGENKNEQEFQKTIDCFIKFYKEEMSNPKSVIAQFDLTMDSLEKSMKLNFPESFAYRTEELEKLANYIIPRIKN